MLKGGYIRVQFGLKADPPRLSARGSECDTTRALMLEASFVYLGALLQTSGILTLDVESSRLVRNQGCSCGDLGDLDLCRFTGYL